MMSRTFFLGAMTSLILLATASELSASSSNAVQQDLSQPTSPRLAERRETGDQERQAPPRQHDPVTGYPIVQSEGWVFEEDLPWSELVLIRRDSQDDYVAVPDRSYETGPGADLRNPGIASLWSRDELVVMGYGIDQVCFMGFVCDTDHPVLPVSAASLKVGDQVFALRGKDSTFEISDRIAWALKTAEPEQVWLRVAIAGGSNYATRPIGADTIAAFHTLYQDAEPTEVAALPDPPMGTVSRLPESLPPDLPEVDESEWRRQSGVTWSQPIIVRDDFAGDYLAVLDRDYSLNSWTNWSSGIITNWSADQLAIHIYEGDATSYACWAVDVLKLDIAGQTFYLEGQNNIFPISDELATVLASAPGEAPLLSYYQSEDEQIIRKIGPDTVSAWPLIYAPRVADPGPDAITEP